MTDAMDLEGAAGLDAMRDAACVVNLRETPVERARRLLTPLMRRCLIEMVLAHPDRGLLLRLRNGVWSPSPHLGDALEQVSDYSAGTARALWGESLIEVAIRGGARSDRRPQACRLTERGREVGLALSAAKEGIHG